MHGIFSVDLGMSNNWTQMIASIKYDACSKKAENISRATPPLSIAVSSKYKTDTPGEASLNTRQLHLPAIHFFELSGKCHVSERVTA